MTDSLNLDHLVKVCLPDPASVNLLLFLFLLYSLELSHYLICNFYTHSLEWFRQLLSSLLFFFHESSKEPISKTIWA